MEDQSQPQAQVWARKKAAVEFESIPRTTGPFTGVIAQYFSKRAKALRRPSGRNGCRHHLVAPYLTHVIAILEALNGI